MKKSLVLISVFAMLAMLSMCGAAWGSLPSRLNSPKLYNSSDVFVVAPTGAKYTNIQTAIDDANRSGASATTRKLVLIYNGSYNATKSGILLRQYVDIAGLSPGSVYIYDPCAATATANDNTVPPTLNFGKISSTNPSTELYANVIISNLNVYGRRCFGCLESATPANTLEKHVLIYNCVFNGLGDCIFLNTALSRYTNLTVEIFNSVLSSTWDTCTTTGSTANYIILRNCRVIASNPATLFATQNSLTGLMGNVTAFDCSIEVNGTSDNITCNGVSSNGANFVSRLFGCTLKIKSTGSNSPSYGINMAGSGQTTTLVNTYFDTAVSPALTNTIYSSTSGRTCNVMGTNYKAGNGAYDPYSTITNILSTP